MKKLWCVLFFCCCFSGVLLGCDYEAKKQEVIVGDSSNMTVSMRHLRKIYFDFAIDYRLEYMPIFTEGHAPINADEYLLWVALTNEVWLQTKGDLSAVAIEEAVDQHFEVKELHHQPSEGWNWDSKNGMYEPIPMGYGDRDTLYALIDFRENNVGDNTVYTITYDVLENEIGPDRTEADLQRYREEIWDGSYLESDHLNVYKKEKITFYWSEEGEPVFLSHEVLSE